MDFHPHLEFYHFPMVLSGDRSGALGFPGSERVTMGVRRRPGNMSLLEMCVGNAHISRHLYDNRIF